MAGAKGSWFRRNISVFFVAGCALLCLGSFALVLLYPFCPSQLTYLQDRAPFIEGVAMLWLVLVTAYYAMTTRRLARLAQDRADRADADRERRESLDKELKQQDFFRALHSSELWGDIKYHADLTRLTPKNARAANFFRLEGYENYRGIFYSAVPEEWRPRFKDAYARVLEFQGKHSEKVQSSGTALAEDICKERITTAKELSLPFVDLRDEIKEMFPKLEEI